MTTRGIATQVHVSLTIISTSAKGIIALRHDMIMNTEKLTPCGRREFECQAVSSAIEHAGKELRRYQCNHCDRRFDKRADIARHEASVHRDKLVSPPPLSYCTYQDCSRKDRGFTRSDNFREHMRRVHGEIHHKGRL